MAYKKRFTNQHGTLSPISGVNSNPGSWNGEKQSAPGYSNEFAFRNYQSRLPEVYIGHPNRIERYNQYENMDCDPEINACLDILSEFSTQMNEHNHTPFEIQFNSDPTQTETAIIGKQLQQWCKLNEMETRVFKIFRNTMKYGDQVFIRDPETFKLYWVDMTKVVKVIVNESEGKEPEQYVVKDINPNLQNLSVAEKTTTDFQSQPPTAGYAAPSSYSTPNQSYGGSGSRFSLGINEAAIDARHVVHLSLTEGLDRYWPFGQSVLETIFKVFKQKELLEDAILIYRIQRAPERRVFKIDVGNMPSHMAMSYVNRIKDEIHQRRIPSVQGGQSILDATYNPLCLDLSTRIPLLDGRTLALSELITEFESGKENWAYSCDPVTGKVVPGVINWAGITRRNTEVIKITFDNGQTLTCTPDHKIPVFGKGFVEAQHLTPEDSLIAFNTRNQRISGGKTNEYQQVWDHESREWIWTHRMVGEFFREIGKHQEFTYLPENIGAPKAVIHHRDSDRFNNDPRNLTYMNKEDHILYHAAQKTEFWATMTEEYRTEMTGKIAATVKQNWDNMSDVDRQAALLQIREAQRRAVWLRKNDPEHAACYAVNASESRRRYIQNNPEFAAQLNKNLEKRVKFNNQPLTLTFDMIQIVADIVKAHSKNKKEVMKLCSSNEQLMNLVRKHNSGMTDGVTQNKIDLSQFGEKKMNYLIKQFGYRNWKHFVGSIDNFNHRIVSIERVDSRDTGTITIDGTERWHNYHTFAIESGIFIKNSINEDYFFPVTADGRGSDVTTLPGGQNLNEIDDLRYFNNRLARGLRVPSSYLPTGPEDNPTPLSDGRVGTAMIQEFRFNKYCERLQGYISRKLNEEFKMFMRWRGFNIDSSLFDIKFNPPQNFAAYRQAEIDTARVNTFTTMVQLPYMSTRFTMERFLGLSQEEIKKNEKLWQEEREEPEDEGAKGSDLRTVGVSSADIESDLENAEGMPPDGMPPEEGMAPEVTAPVAPPGGAPGGAAVAPPI
jgi:hypothetical protein